MTSEWRTAAQKALNELIATGDEFTADDLIERVGPPDAEHTPNGRNNVIGSMFNSASARGRIRQVGYVKSRTKSRKGGSVRIWRGVVL